MHATGATEVRKNWSKICDDVVRVRPSLIKRTHDYLFLASRNDMLKTLSILKFRITVSKEEDGSYTIISEDLDLAENAPTEESAKKAMAESILEYAEEYYDEYELYSRAPNRAQHLPYVIKALLLAYADEVEEEMVHA